MNDNLAYLLHFFNDREHVFKTITMVEHCQFDEVCNKLASQKGWYAERFRPDDRIEYLTRRLFVEEELYKSYTQEYGHLKEKAPVYFYLHPNITQEKALELAKQRSIHGEAAPKILMIKIADIGDFSNVTFTLHDSFTAYWKKAIDAGIKCREEERDRIVLQDHNKVFPFSEIEQIHQKYEHQGIYYEVQIWDYELLDRISYLIIGEEEK